MQRLRTRLQEYQLLAMKLNEPEQFEKQEQAFAPDVANRNRETVQQWLASQLSGGNPSDLPLEAIDVDGDHTERLRDWDKIKKALAPALPSCKSASNGRHKR
ncbi:MAG TPA: hypothetical protein VMF67_11050 [Rhizomicrobium sp.]|nr:hypothetical protein [Rhizomicrobium sp.]